MTRIEKSCRYVCHKWLLFTICFVLIYFDLMLILFSDNIANMYNDYGHKSKETINGTIMVESIISIIFAVFGVVGAYRENYCCTVLFSISMTLSVVAEIYSSIIAPLFWLLTFLYIFITMIAFSFARLIREHMIAQVLQPQSAYMHDYGRTYGLRFNSFQFFNQQNNQVLQLQTIEFEGRQLPPYYSNDNPTRESDSQMRTLPHYEELSPYPPSYQESVRSKTNDSNENTNNNYIQHI